jgi:2-oxoglutarate dehydrogenase E2 component (dihydrolipoamide succinyltransferase)
MPALGESVTEGTVTRWLKKEGETVEVDEPLLEVSTDKVDTEIPSPAAGVVLSIKVAEDETVEVGAELAVIGGPGDAPAPAAAAPAQEAPAAAPAPAPAPQPAQAAPAPAQAPAPAGPAPAAPSGPASGTPVVLPALGESVTEGTVTRWLKSVGDSVDADEPLLEVSTDKVDTEIPSPAAGVVVAINVGEDETVAVGTTLAVIGAPGSSPAAAAPTPQPAPVAVVPTPPQAQAPAPAASAPAPAPAVAPDPAPAPIPAPAPPSPTPAAPAPAPVATATAPQPAPAPAQTAAQTQSQNTAQPDDDGPGAYVTPLVRKLAAERGVDLATINGTGVGGRIRKQDVIEAAKALAPKPAPAPAAVNGAAAPSTPAAPVAVSPLRGRTEKLSRLRTVIAKRMVESLQVSAQLTTVVEVDVTPIARLRDRAKKDFEAREGVKLSFLPFFAMAAVEALKQYPQVNASIDMEAGTVTYHGSENLGIAVDTERGLLVPVIKNAGDLNLGGIARAIADLAARTRDNKVSPDELGGGTFTLTNTGSRGALFDTPIINQPQVGILGTGAVVKRPAVVTDPVLGEVIAVRSIVYLALSYDHRLVDGADAARFLTTIKARLEEGRFESELGL